MAYRTEDGVPCIDVRLQTVEQIFDNRDPAPFRERDLDPDLADYLVDAGEDLFTEDKLRIVFWLDKPCQAGEIEEAIRAHLDYAIDRIRRLRRRRRRTGTVALLVGLVLVVILIAFSQFVASSVGGSLGNGLREGIVISCWVVMWRPIETFTYDWIPQRHERRVLEKLRAAPVEVRAADSKDAPPPGTGEAGTSERRRRI